MITYAEIETELEKANFTREQTRALSKALEMAQRKTATDIEGDLREYMDGKFAVVDARFEALEARFEARFEALEARLEARFEAVDERFKALKDIFVTKEEFGAFKADIFKWMFIFWSTQLLAIAGMLFGLARLLKP